ncbi:Fip1-domain-containing protein [Exidia glandulosa HHB12029]|uniref:Fip1-domain-containing protein n=1 Tax=Exidia glandulosa HHB12029 TaxID=1314781 RepID=A0A165MQU8_EXIGL|nr:Fip1-domain-containing protein [Exidia glandulosa HHB12029]
MDDDDEFLYGGAPVAVAASAPSTSTNMPLETIPSEAVAETVSVAAAQANGDDEAESGSDEEMEDEEDDDVDIEIITEAPARSLDFRSVNRPPAARPTIAKPALPPAPALTTEYTPIQRDAAIPLRAPVPQKPPASPPPASTPTTTVPTVASAVVVPAPTTAVAGSATPTQPDIDTTKLPPVHAPPSHPQIDPDVPGTIEGRSVLEVDLANLAPEKPWRRPGSDLSDWFNYGFDELSWEAYCYRRKDVADLGSLLKASVLNYAQLDENQVNALPPDFRQMVIAGTFAPPAPVGVGAMTMPMQGQGGDMAFNVNGGMMPDMSMNMMGGGGGYEGGGEGMDGYAAMGMGGGGEYGMQDGGQGMYQASAPQQQQQQQQQQPQQQQQQQPQPVPQQPQVPVAPAAARVPPAGPSRGIPGAPRGRGAYAGRGRGIPVGPARATSPLPPNVPTGPRSQTRYKDRDGNAPSADGLDYGGGGGGGSVSRDDDDRDRDHSRSSRKRRGSPEDSGRASKRR